MNPKKNPLASVIIVNFNGLNHIKKCLLSIKKNNYKNFEVVVVDNGSQDGSREFLIKKMRADKRVRGTYLSFLDNDTKVDRFWLSKSITFMENNGNIGACQCQLLLMDDHKKIDYVGDYLTRTGFLMQPFKMGDRAKSIPDETKEIFAAKSAGMIVKRKAFETAGGFDSDYFIYVEETDLCWRIWLTGYEIVYFPKSVVYHKFGTSYRLFPEFQSFLARFHGSKNYISTLIKNLSAQELLLILPLHLILWMIVAFQQILTLKIKSGMYILKGIFWVPFNLPSLLAKRKVIQSKRVIDDKELFEHILQPINIKYFFDKFFSKSTVKGFKAINEK